jgi:hypothetical protein
MSSSTMTKSASLADTDPAAATYAAVATALREIADDLSGLSGDPIAVTVSIQPWHSHCTDVVGVVDQIAQALFGRPATTVAMSNGTFHHSAAGPRGTGERPVQVAVFGGVPDPALVARDAELAALRAELAQLRTTTI